MSFHHHSHHHFHLFLRRLQDEMNKAQFTVEMRLKFDAKFFHLIIMIMSLPINVGPDLASFDVLTLSLPLQTLTIFTSQLDNIFHQLFTSIHPVKFNCSSFAKFILSVGIKRKSFHSRLTLI